ncbi:MAG: hypothetical protein HKN68_15885, partial [Saprospiraceae bacterium]|nr:hypothetical protein [Saprospiraceae bacterium]
MKKLLAVALFLCFFTAYSQEYRIVEPFTKIMVGPHVELLVEEGDNETVLLSNIEVDEDKINIKVKGNTLKIYLDQAKVATKHKKEKNKGYKMKVPIYEGRKVTATVTYKYLHKLSLRGEEKHEVKSILDTDKFKINLYGEGRLVIGEIESEVIKAKLYGNNYLNIKNGTTYKQKYKSYGENKVDTRNLESTIAKSSNFGENDIRLQASDKIKFSSMGVSIIRYSGVS